MIKTSDSMGRPRNMTQPFNMRDEMGVTISAAQAWIWDMEAGPQLSAEALSGQW